jgi:hypothetical protein
MHPKLDWQTEAKVVQALATGMTERQAASAFGIAPSTVHKIAAREENAEVIRFTREQQRRGMMDVLAAEDGPIFLILKRLKLEAQTAAARDIDALARAAHSLEKAASSVAGDNRGRGERVVRHVVELAPWARGEVVEGTAIRHSAENVSELGEPKLSELTLADGGVEADELYPMARPGSLTGASELDASQPPAPQNEVGGPGLRGEQLREELVSRASRDIATTAVKLNAALGQLPVLPPGPAGLPESDVAVPDDFEV